MRGMRRERVLEWLAALATRRPWWVVGVGVALAVGCVALAGARLGFQPDRNKLVSEDLAWNRAFQRWVGTFGGVNDVFVVVARPEPRPARPSGGGAEAFVAAVGERLAREPAVERVVWRIDPSGASPRAVRLLRGPELDAALAELVDAAAVVGSATPEALVAQGLRDWGGGSAGGDSGGVARLEAFGRLVAAMGARLETPAGEALDLGAAVERAGAGGARFLETPSGRLLVVRVTPRLDPASLSPAEAAIGAVRRVLEEVSSEWRRSGRDVPRHGLTGQEVVEADETAAAVRDAGVASAVAAVLIAGVFVVAFRGVRLPLLLMAALLVGTAWSFGFATLAVGHLQVISVVFTAMLFGLGGDFGVHVATRYERVRGRADVAGFGAALADTMRGAGPGVLTGAVTTAAAFATTAFTDFTGVAEMGLIAAGAVVLCMAAMLTVFPALLRLLAAGRAAGTPAEGRRLDVFDPRWALPAVRRPWLTLALAGVAAAAAVVGLSRVRFDYDLMALMPRGVESVEWSRELSEVGGQSLWFAVSVADSLGEVRERSAAFRALGASGSGGGVGAVMGAGLLAPPAETDAAVAAARAAFERAVRRVEASPGPAEGVSVVGQLAGVRVLLGARLMGEADPAARRAGVALASAIDGLLAAAQRLDPAELEARLGALRADYARWRASVAERVRVALDGAPLSPVDLPAEVIRPYVADTPGGPRYAIEVFMEPGSGGASAAERIEAGVTPEALAAFVSAVRSVDPEATGVARQVYESGRLIWTSYLWAGALGLAVVSVVVWVDFRRVSDTLLALLPVSLGFLLTFGLMGGLGVALNPANIIVLPLMFGIGVDAGVHVLHRWRSDPGGLPPGLTGGTGKGITLTSLTTMIGFGALTTASHRGIASLGLVMAAGIALTLLACYTVVPAALALRGRGAAAARR